MREPILRLKIRQMRSGVVGDAVGMQKSVAVWKRG